MKIPARAVTIVELRHLIAAFVDDECDKDERSRRMTHKKCGRLIRTGYFNLFYVNDDGSLDPGIDGFGIGPQQVPYCEKCDPPDGFNHAYARRILIKHDPQPA